MLSCAYSCVCACGVRDAGTVTLQKKKKKKKKNLLHAPALHTTMYVHLFFFLTTVNKHVSRASTMGRFPPVTSKINVSGGDIHVASREPTIEPIRSGPSATVR